MCRWFAMYSCFTINLDKFKDLIYANIFHGLHLLLGSYGYMYIWFGALDAGRDFADDSTDAIEVTSTGGTSLTYDSSAGHYIQNWNTPSNSAGKCFKADLTTADGTHTVAYFKLTRYCSTRRSSSRRTRLFYSPCRAEKPARKDNDDIFSNILQRGNIWLVDSSASNRKISPLVPPSPPASNIITTDNGNGGGSGLKSGDNTSTSKQISRPITSKFTLKFTMVEMSEIFSECI